MQTSIFLTHTSIEAAVHRQNFMIKITFVLYIADKSIDVFIFYVIITLSESFTQIDLEFYFLIVSANKNEPFGNRKRLYDN